jgi:hypothetical protein
MSIERTTHLYEFLARVETDPLALYGRVVGMHVSEIERFSEDGQVLYERILSAASIDYTNLAVLMHNDDLAALKAAVDAEIAARA